MEDETDVQAAKELRAEVRADIAEFDENAAAVTGAGEEEAAAAAAAAAAGEEAGRRRLDEKIENEFKSIETEVKIFSKTFL